MEGNLIDMWPLRGMQTLTILFLSVSLTHSQEFRFLSDLYNKGEYISVIDTAEALVFGGTKSVEVYALLGRAYVDIGNPKKGERFLDSVLTNSGRIPRWMSAWSLLYRGKAYFHSGNRSEAEECFEKAIKTDATANVVQTAHGLMNLTGLNRVYRRWNILETKNFVFHFQRETKVEDIQEFATSRQAAFDSINGYFGSNLPKKIDFFVWNDRVEYLEGERGNSGFADPLLCIVHSRYWQTIGHEMTHVISFYATETKHRTSFVNEGTSVCFDLSSKDKFAIAEEAQKDLEFAIIEIWQSDKKFREIEQEKGYAIAGAFVSFLIQEAGKQKFLQLLADQSYKNAKSIYGDEIDRIIENFENRIKSGKR
jgi:tetratricopeptide (TPR) repeat protein